MTSNENKQQDAKNNAEQTDDIKPLKRLLNETKTGLSSPTS